MMIHNFEMAIPQSSSLCLSATDSSAYFAGSSTHDETVELKIPGQTRYIYIARQAVDAISEEIKLSKDDRAAVRLAVGEACNNAVRYSKSASRSNPSPVVISFRVDPEALEIDVTNAGNGFHPAPGVKMPDPLSENGRGIALIEAMMDSVEFKAANGNTTVRMRKLREPS